MRRLRPLPTAALVALGALALLAAKPAPRPLERALDAQRLLAAERPDDAGVANDLGNLLALAGDTPGAEEAYRRAIELAPRDPSPRFNYGLLLLESGRQLAAMRQFRDTVEVEPRHAWAHFQIGALYEDWGLNSFARRAFARAFRIEPRLADARFNPSVLDHPDTTPGMMMAWKAGNAAALAVPRGYSDPSRIAGLLIEVPAPPAKPVEPEAVDEEERDGGGGFARLEGGGGASAGRGDVRKPDETAGEAGAGFEGEPPAPAGPRVLTGADLRPSGSVNQIVTPGGGAGGGRTGGVAPGRSRSVPARPRYVPGRDSTGRLDLRLAPPSDVPAPLAG